MKWKRTRAFLFHLLDRTQLGIIAACATSLKSIYRLHKACADGQYFVPVSSVCLHLNKCSPWQENVANDIGLHCCHLVFFLLAFLQRHEKCASYSFQRSNVVNQMKALRMCRYTRVMVVAVAACIASSIHVTVCDGLQPSTTSTIQKLFHPRSTSYSFSFRAFYFFHSRRWRNKCAELRHLIGILDYRFAFFFFFYFFRQWDFSRFWCVSNARVTRVYVTTLFAHYKNASKMNLFKMEYRSSTALILTHHHQAMWTFVIECVLCRGECNFFQFVSLILL